MFTPELLIGIVCLIASIAAIFANRKHSALKAAEMIVKHQSRPIDVSVIDEGFAFYKGDELKRYTTLVRRVRQQFGHEGFCVGHMAWVVKIMDRPDIDENTVTIPKFN